MKRETKLYAQARVRNATYTSDRTIYADILASDAEVKRLRKVVKLLEVAWKSHGYCECTECSEARAALKPHAEREYQAAQRDLGTLRAVERYRAARRELEVAEAIALAVLRKDER